MSEFGCNVWPELEAVWEWARRCGIEIKENKYAVDLADVFTDKRLEAKRQLAIAGYLISIPLKASTTSAPATTS